MLPHVLLALIAPLLVLAGDDGGITGATSSTEAAGYSCDPSKCKLPTCNCASTSPPGGISPVSLLRFLSVFYTCGRRQWRAGVPRSAFRVDNVKITTEVEALVVRLDVRALAGEICFRVFFDTSNQMSFQWTSSANADDVGAFFCLVSYDIFLSCLTA